MKRKYLGIVMSLMLAVTMLAGCGGNEEETAAVQETENTEEMREEKPEGKPEGMERGAANAAFDADATYGEVREVKDGSIVIEVGTMKQMEVPDEMPEEIPEMSEEPGEMPEEPAQGEAPDGEMSMLDLTGEEQEILITENTVIKRQSMGGMNMGMGGAGGQRGGQRPDGEPVDGEAPELPEGMENGEKPEMPEDMEKPEVAEKPENAEGAGANQQMEKLEGMSEDGMGKGGFGGQMAAEEITLADISEGDMVAVTFDEDGNALEITVISMEQMELPASEN